MGLLVSFHYNEDFVILGLTILGFCFIHLTVNTSVRAKEYHLLCRGLLYKGACYRYIQSPQGSTVIICRQTPAVLFYVPQVTEAMQGSQYDVVVDDIIDEVIEPQLRQVIIEAWRDVVDVDRNKQVKKVSYRKNPSSDNNDLL